MVCVRWGISYRYDDLCSSQYDGVYTKLLPQDHLDPQLISINYSNNTGNCGGGPRRSVAEYSYTDANGNNSTASITIVNNSFSPHTLSDVFFFCAEENRYDCVNHKCELSTKYNTPGLYKSLADCEAVCGKGGVCASGKQCLDPVNYCPPGKVCIEEGEHTKIQNLIQQVKSKSC